MKSLKFSIIGALMLLLFNTSCSYNSMVEKQESVSSQWAQVENSYQRRADLIPNLVATVKGYAAHEQQTLTDVIEARAKATQITVNSDDLTEENIQKYQKVQGQLGSALGRLMMVQEQYPELKANQNFTALQDELAGTENRIAVERNKYNEVVKEYNQYIRKFPNNLWAGMFGFKPKAYFETDVANKTAPSVQF